MVAHRQRRQLQPGDPALGAHLQRGQIGSAERQPHHLVEKRCSFIRREAQIARVQLGHGAMGAPPGKRQGRIGA
jgi:hypothetical protein